MCFEQIDRIVQSSRSRDGAIACDRAAPWKRPSRSIRALDFARFSLEHELPATDTSHGVDDIGRCIDNWSTSFKAIVLRDLLGGYIEYDGQRKEINLSSGPPRASIPVSNG